MAKGTQKMIDKDPAAIEVLTYLWVLALSGWGGIVSYLNKVRSGALARFSLSALIGDVVTSGFVGILTYWLTVAADMNELAGAACVGIAGHMGSRAIAGLENLMQRRIEKL